MKTVLITGASAGIGKATALTFNQPGYKLILLARSEEKLQELAKELVVPYHLIACDIQNKNLIQDFFNFLPKEFKSIDILVNNAGLALGTEKATEGNLEEWETMVDTNIKGLLYCTNLVLKQMKLKNSGHIINLGSIAGTYAYPGGNVYCASKAFVNHFSKCLKADLLGTKIKVTNIEPGRVATDFSLIRFHGDQEKADKIYDTCNPLTAEDIANTIYWSATQPKHVNINSIEIMPVSQACGELQVADNLF